MRALLTPHLHLDSVLELEAADLAGRGLKGLLLDVDCTLKDYCASVFPPDVAAWVRKIRGEGIRLCLLSNGKPARIGRLAGVLEIDFVARAFKPSPFGCYRGLKKLGLGASETGLVGD